MASQTYVVEIAGSGALLNGGNDMPLSEAVAMARVHTQKEPGRRVNILVYGGRRRVVQTWQDGSRL